MVAEVILSLCNNLEKLVKKELEKLRERPLGPQQIKKAKQQLIGQIAISQESDLNLMLALGKSFMLGAPVPLANPARPPCAMSSGSLSFGFLNPLNLFFDKAHSLTSC